MSAPSHYSPARSADHTVSDPRAAYQTRVAEISLRERKLTLRDQRFVRLRITVFVAALGLITLCLGDPEHVSWWWLTIPAVLFFGLLPFHQACVRRLKRARATGEIQARYLRGLDGGFGTEDTNGRGC